MVFFILYNKNYVKYYYSLILLQLLFAFMFFICYFVNELHF